MLINDGSDTYGTDIKSFLGRPRAVTSFDWLDTQIANTQLYTVVVPDLFTTTPYWRAKLNNFQYFRCTSHFRLVINGSPFQLGKLIMTWEPLAGLRGNHAPNAALGTSTILPHVEIDVAACTSGELIGHYVSPKAFYDCLARKYSWGRMRIKVLNQLNGSGAANTVRATLYAWMTDVELYVPTVNDFSVPMVVPSIRHRAQSGAGKVISNRESSRASKTNTTIATQPIIPIRTGPVSSIASFVGNMALATSKIAGTVSDAASSYGWCKPDNLSLPITTSFVPGKGYNNTDGVDMSTYLALKTDAKLTSARVFSKRDEMSITDIVTRYCMFDRFTWSDTTLEGTALYIGTVAPFMGIGPTLGGNLGTTNWAMTPMGSCAAPFRYWRGTIQYRLSFASNAFFSGRLAITYLPMATGIPTDLDAHARIILDLRDATEFYFDVPYVSNTPWKVLKPFITVYNDNLTDQHACGRFAIHVINGLVSNNTANSIECNLSVCGGPDLSFAGHEFYYAFGGPGTIPLAQGVKSNQVRRYKPGVPRLISMQDSLLPTSAAALSIGEHISSVRQIIKRFGSTSTVQVADMLINLGRIGANNPSAGPLPSFNWWLGSYALWRGSIRLKFMLVANAVVSPVTLGIPMEAWIHSYLDEGDTTTGLYVYNTAPVPNGLCSRQHVSSTNGLLEITVPFYSNTSCSLVADNASSALLRSCPRVAWRIDPQCYAGNVTVRVFIAAGDDFELGTYVTPQGLNLGL